MAFAFEDLCVLTMVIVWITLQFIVQWTKPSGRERKPGDKSERGLTSRDSDTVTSGHAPSRVLNKLSDDRSSSTLNDNTLTSSSCKNRLLLSSTEQTSSHGKADGKHPSSSRSETLCLSDVSCVPASTISEISKTFSQTGSNKFSQCRLHQLVPKHCSESSTEKPNEHRSNTSCLSGGRTNENDGVGQKTEVEMEARLRRRMLQKTPEVSAQQHSSWRSKVYQSENTNSSNSSYLQEGRRSSLRGKETARSTDNHSNDAETSRETRRRRSEGSTCSVLSERLARRRAQRLEEQRDSVSQDGSCDSSRDGDARWSRDRSVRSLESVDSSEMEDGIIGGQTRPYDEKISSSGRNESWNSNRRSSRDSVVSTESIDNNESFEERSCNFWHRSKDSGCSTHAEPEMGQQSLNRPRKWSSKDSNFISADSSCSFRTSEDGSLGSYLQGGGRLSRVEDSVESQSTEGGFGITVQNDDDSAFSWTKDKLEDAPNVNNNNDAILLPQSTAGVSGVSRKHGLEEFIEESDELKKSSSEFLGVESNGSCHRSDRTSSIFSSNCAEHVQPSSQSVDNLLFTTSTLVDESRHATDQPHTTNGRSDVGEFRGRRRLTDSSLEHFQDVQESMASDTSENKCQGTYTNTNTTSQDHKVLFSDVATRDLESSITKTASKSENSASRKRRARKDKSALRKSALNMAEQSTTGDGRVEGNSQIGQEPGHHEERPRRVTEGSFVSQHAIFWEKHAPNIQNATPPRTSMPARYTGDKEKLTATRQKFMQNAAKASDTSSSPAPRLKTDGSEDAAPKPIARGRTDFNQLLQKFSGSESNSEKSDTDLGSSTVSGVPRRRNFVKRQEAKDVISSSEDSDVRRTPDRTQSLKVRPRPEIGILTGTSEQKSASSTTLPETPATVEKSSSFRSDFMNRKWAHRSTETLQVQKESPLLQNASFMSSAPVKTQLGSKSESDSSGASRDTQNHGTSGKLSGRSSQALEEERHPGTQSSLQNKSRDLKSSSLRDTTSPVRSEGNLVKEVDTSVARTIRTSVNSPITSTVKTSLGSPIPTTSKTSVSSSVPTSVSSSVSVTDNMSASSSVPTSAKTSLDSSVPTSTKTSVSSSTATTTKTSVSSSTATTAKTSVSSSTATTDKTARNTMAQTAARTSVGTSVSNTTKTLPATVPNLTNTSLDTSSQATAKTSLHSTAPTLAKTHVANSVQAASGTSLKTSVPTTPRTSLQTIASAATKNSQEGTVEDISKSALNSPDLTSAKTTLDTFASNTARTSDPNVTNTSIDKSASTTTETSLNTSIEITAQTSLDSSKPTPSKRLLDSSSTKTSLDSSLTKMSRDSTVNTQTTTSVNTSVPAIAKTSLDTSVTSRSKTSLDSSVLAKTKASLDSSTPKTAETSLNTHVPNTAKNPLDNIKSISSGSSITNKENEVLFDNQIISNEAKSISQEATSIPHEDISHESKPTDSSVTTLKGQEIPDVKNDITVQLSAQKRDFPQAKPRSSIERDVKQPGQVSTTSVTTDPLPKLPTVSSTLSSSVSSSEITSMRSSVDLSTSISSDVRRASSFKEASVSRNDSIERRKGILKRNTSLNKQDMGGSMDSASFPIVDPQLAKILRQRKQIVGDAGEKEEAETSDEVSELVRKSKPMSAAEEIEENLRYSQQKAAQRGLNPDQDEGLKRISVAERIYSMQNKIEEEKFAVVTPRSRSGLSTPRSRQRSGVITPNIMKSVDETSQSISMTSSVTAATDSAVSYDKTGSVPISQQLEQHPENDPTALSGSQLMEKLSKIANDSEKYEQRRHRFQHRARNDWRHQTQPVTCEEIRAADSLETVSAFRALVRKQTSINALEQIKAETSTTSMHILANSGKKTEFPQHLVPPTKLPRRSRKLRHRTLPVTAEELNAVPEHQMLVTDPDWVKFDVYDKRDSKADSGILSGSEADSLYHAESLRSLTLEMDLYEHDPSRMSVTDKASMFRVLEEKTRAERDKEKSASGAKRYINRKKRERSQTTPITDDEVKTASEMGGGSGYDMKSPSRDGTVNLHEPEVVNRSRSSSISEDIDVEQPDDELVKLSISEKVKLFSQPRDTEKQPAKTEVAVVRRRTRKVASRFNTQPVTTEEVEKAAAFSRISPLAMSMVKPPDPELLMVLPLKDQRELMAQHAEMFLSQNSLRSRSGSTASQSQPSSRRASVSLEGGEEAARAGEDGLDKSDKKGILKDKCASAKDLHEVKSILKADPVKAKSESEVHSILKMDAKHVMEPSFISPEPRGILKKTRSEDIGGLESNDDIKGILKHTDSEEEETHIKPRSRSNSQPLGILKIENPYQPTEHPLEIRSILKAPSQENMHESHVMKSALRRGSVESDNGIPTTSALKSAMRAKSKNSLDADDSHTEEPATSELNNQGADCDLNSNNSHKHIGLAMSSSAERVDHFSSTTYSRHASSTITTTKSSASAEGNNSFSTSTSTVTAVTSSGNSMHVLEGADNNRSGESASEDGESSSGEILDDTPRSRLKRKSRFSDRAARSERYRTQPPELTETTSSTTASVDSTIRRKYKYEGRHRTQPITPNEMREAEATTPAADLTRTPGGSIADRLNQLKTSGEEQWKKRVGKKEELLASPDVIKLREKPGVLDNRPCSIADRLNELETSKTTWKERVEESDAKQFTVAGRLAQPSSKNTSPLSSPVTPTKDFIAKIPLPKDIVQDTSVVVESVRKATPRDGMGEEPEEKREPVKVEVPDMGEEIENFFAVKPIDEITDKVEMEVDDFNNIFIESEMILSTVRKVRPNRKTRPTSHNPLKTMSQKLEIRQEYTEILYGTAEKELKRVKKEGLAKEAGFAQAALAGLASKENFKEVELRRTDSGSSVHGQAALDPFKELMLLHVKGRRSVQTRLVEPHTRSINEGDCYILVTADKVIHWEGRYANVIEKAKASEVASYIQQKKDLGCKKSNEVLSVFQDKDHLGAGKLFWAALEGEKEFQACGPDAEDELYENSIVKCNMVYKLVGNALQPYEEYWGAVPKYEMLKKNEVLVFDFGTEFYIWQGKGVSMEQRKLGLKLSKQLYEKGYDYTESAINPLSPLRIADSGGLPLNAPTRPSWTIFGKVNQNMETILFREKFSDWPDPSRLIGYKGHGPSETVSKELMELKPFDAKLLIPCNTIPVNLKLEGANLGRGVKWSEDMQGFVKEQDIITLDVTAWHVLEYEHYKLPPLSHGQFHDGDTYVVRWQYMVANANLKSLKGSAARNSLTGRERCAYFFWQGNQSTINEKGASALMTVELDEERGPQVRVLQGKEPPCFLNLFGGKMVVHIGKREDPSTNTQGSWRLYCLRGDYENELYLLEIPVSIDHLRSRSSLVLLNVKTGIVYIWHGAKSPQHVRELCLKAVSRLKENTPLEIGLHEKATITVIEVEEGEEKREIWSALDKQDRSVYHSLLSDPKTYSHTLRLFHMSSVNLVFEVHEQLNPARAPDLVTPFPFLQSDLYKSTQPALFLIDNEREVYLWQGWWPIGSHDTENVHTGSATARFNLDRRLAMETTLHYCKEKNSIRPPTAYLVCAGVEPVRFTSLFPYWEEDTIVKDIAIEEGKTPDYIEAVSDILHRLTQTRYTLAELQERPLPEGVDPLKLETYLYDADFEEILDMTRDEFYGQPHWKQIDLKKHVGLF